MAAVVTPSIVVAGAFALVAATDVRAPAVGGSAAAFLPADGAAGWSLMPGGVAQHEHRRSPGATALLVLPQAAAEIAIAVYEDVDRAVPHWSTYWGPEAGRPAGVPREVYSITPEGIRIVASIGFPLDSLFVPGLVVLPADAEPGAEWSSAGESLWGGLRSDGSAFGAQYSYAAESSAREPEDPALVEHARDGCLETLSALTLTPAEGDTLVYRQTSLWCPGEGQVATIGAFDGDAPITIPPADAPDVAVVLDGRAPSWQHPDEWDAAAAAARWSDPVWGDTAFTTAPALEPVMVGDLLAVADLNSGDLTLLQEDDQGLVVARVLHPGGDVAALGAAGETLFAATSQRDLVAYTVRGDRVWTRRTADLVVTPPVTDGRSGLVVAGVDGTVRALDAATGEDRWVADVSAEGLESLVVSGDLAVAGDRVGGVAAVALDDGAVVWTHETPDEVAAFATDGDALFVARDDEVERLDRSTGATLWSADVGTGVDDLAVVGDHVVAQTWGDLVALDPESGAIAWRAAGANALATDGSSLIVAGGASVRLVADDGTDAAAWPVEAESLGSFRFLTGATNSVWLTDAKIGIVRIGP